MTMILLSFFIMCTVSNLHIKHMEQNIQDYTIVWLRNILNKPNLNNMLNLQWAGDFTSTLRTISISTLQCTVMLRGLVRFVVALLLRIHLHEV